MQFKKANVPNRLMMRQQRYLRIVVFLSGLQAGGAERVATRVCEWLSEAGHDVCLLTLDSVGNDFYSIPHGVTRIGLDETSPSKNLVHATFRNFIRLIKIRKEVKRWKADLVLSLCDTNNVLMLFALIGFNCRKVISERNDPIQKTPSRFWQMTRRMAYPMAHLHVSQSDYVSKWLRGRYPNLRCVTIGNTAGSCPAYLRHRGSGLAENGVGLRIVTVGRLTEQKGMDIVLRALADARNKTKARLELYIVGGGEQLDSLKILATQLGLSDDVKFRGMVSDIWDELAISDIFVLGSRWEGFPNVLVEAMSVGLPSITSKCKGGVEDILRSGFGVVALDYPPGDAAALSQAIVQLAESPKLRQELSIAGRNRAADFSPEAIGSSWRRVLEALCFEG
jgi:glycosyltransferase involved in cell wall biosynthesis